MPSRQEKKRAKRRAKYLEVRDDVLESARASYKADPEKKRTGERERYHADPVSWALWPATCSALEGSIEYWHYHPCGSLYCYLRRGGGEGDAALCLSKANLLRMASTACSGLAHHHTHITGLRSKPIMAHRDLKSSNILVKADLTCCIADISLMGVVVWRRSFRGSLLPGSLGTNRYMSPEILSASFPLKMSADSLVRFYVNMMIILTLGSGDRYYLGFTLKGGCVVEVHVCRGDQYVTICADTWSNIEASCQQPGYPPYVAITVVKGVLGGSISSISGFACNGAEPSLSACPVVTRASVPCSLATSGQLRDVAKAGNSTHGDIRLVMSQINGPLKVCISIAWGTMCSEQVTSREVVCKQLNASKPNIRVNATGQYFFYSRGWLHPSADHWWPDCRAQML
eukprot:Em0010g616a